MGIRITSAKRRAGTLFSCLVLCTMPTIASADEAALPVSVLKTTTLQMVTGDQSEGGSSPTPFPVISDNQPGLSFDVGGSDKRKLQLQLSQPLMLSAGTTTRTLDHGVDILGLDATLNVPLTDHFSLSAGAGKQLGKSHFQSLGSIRCMNGTLRADSYTASGCRFVDEPLASSERNRLDLGTEMRFGNSAASLSWFTQDSEIRQPGVRGPGGMGAQAVMGNSLLSPNLGNPLLSSIGSDPLQVLNSEASGVNLNFKVGIATDNEGDIRVGLAFSRILDANYQGLYNNSADALSWTLAEPFNAASLDFEWSRGTFSSGIQAFYREPVDFLDRASLDSFTTFDVHFTWRTPWKANLSVGASNVLNAGLDTKGSSENQPVDPFESIYGRIPYVRYKQDL